MEKWQIKNSEKLEISEISEKLFQVLLCRVFDFIQQANRKLGFKNFRKQFPRFPTVPSFWPGRAPICSKIQFLFIYISNVSGFI